MSRRGVVLALMLLAVSTGWADTTFYTDTWDSLSSNWTVVFGTPTVAYNRLYNTPYYTQTQLLYAGTPPSQDYSVQTVPVCGSFDGAFVHYLRASGGNYYQIGVNYYSADQSFNVRLYRYDASEATLLAVASSSCGLIKSAIAGSQITVYIGGTSVISTSDSTYSSGKPGVGTTIYYDSGLGTTTLAQLDTQAPTVPTNLTGVPYFSRVNLSWTASTDNESVAGYKIYRGGSYLGSSTTTSYSDTTVDGLHSSYSYTVLAYDPTGNQSAQSSAITVTMPTSVYAFPDTGAPQTFASSWGAGPEKIALLTGGLAFRQPLFKLSHRTRGPGAQMTASWNSQFWTYDATGSHMNAIDTGYGLGFTFSLGGMSPVYNGSQIDHFEFIDGGGLIHKLYWTSGNKYKSQDSSYLLWDYGASPYPTLTFNDGSVWSFGCVSEHPEADAGTRYPTLLKDANGNTITVTYQGVSALGGTNTTSRLSSMQDALTSYGWTYYTSGAYAGHVQLIQHNGSSGNDVVFTYSTQTNLPSPFDTTSVSGTFTFLTQISFTGTPGPFTLTYDTSGEITKLTVPQGGYFSYTYLTQPFSSPSHSAREVSVRKMSDTGTQAGEVSYTFSHPSGDSSQPGHTQTTLVDPPGNSKVWYFNHGLSQAALNGLSNRFEAYSGAVSGTPLRAIDTTWIQDSSNANPQVSSAVSTLSDGVTQTRSETDRDLNGNVTAVREYPYYQSNSPATTPSRTTSTTYVTSSSYTTRNILNLPSLTKVCAGSAGCSTPATQTSVSYDGYGVGTYSSGTAAWDQSYGSVAYRGNPTSVTTNGMTTGSYYDPGGNVSSTSDPAGHTVATASYTNNASQVSSASAGGNTTAAGYNADTSLASITGSNNDSISFTYASNRPTSTSQPFGGTVTYSYVDTANAVSKTQTSALGKVTKTFMDSFGRVIRASVQETSSTWITTLTVYSACSCSSTGKMKKTSLPFRSDASGNPNSGVTIYWTETTFDALGRPVQVTSPDGTYTAYAYSISTDTNWPGTLTTITDPLGKQKRYLNDVFGRLVRVEELNAGNALVTTARYTYDLMGRMLTAVTGTSTTQTRTWVYNSAGQLTSATNPENGTVTYSYNTDGSLYSKTDAKNQTLYYTYDSNHRLLTVESPLGTVKTKFTYDTEPNSNFNTSYAVGKMTSASNDGYTWHYAYDIGGRATQQTLETPQMQGSYPLVAQAQYIYDWDSRITRMRYPGGLGVPSSAQPGDYNDFTYNVLGQPLTLKTWDTTSYDGNGNEIWVTQAQGATYNAAGQITAWQDTSDYLSRAYDLMGRVTNIHAWSASIANVAFDLNYSYQNDGRASSVAESFSGGTAVSTAYGYDQLNRLVSASKASSWSLAWAYDDFGNRTTQTGTGGAPSMSLSYSSSTNRITTSPYTYDANGNLTQMPDPTAPSPYLDTLSYDVFNRVSTIYQSYTANTTTFKYDAFGRRIERTPSNGYTHVYFYDMGGRLLGELGGGTGVTSKQQYFAGQRIGQYTDRTGSVRFIPGTGWKHYYPYGEEVTSTNSDKYKFADLYRDQDTGLDYAVNRYFASGIARFLTTDPKDGSMRFDDPTSLNRFAYAGNDPVNNADPEGLDYQVCTTVFGQTTCVTHPSGGDGKEPDLTGLLGIGLFGSRQSAIQTPKQMAKDQADLHGRDSTGRDRDRLPAAYRIALDALANGDCQKVFGQDTVSGRTARSTLVSLFANGDQGSIAFGAVKEGWAVTDGGLSQYLPFTNSPSVKITIDNSRNEGWNASSDMENAATLLHELGHATYLLGFRNQEFVNYDWTKARQDKDTQLIEDNCISKLNK